MGQILLAHLSLVQTILQISANYCPVAEGSVPHSFRDIAASWVRTATKTLPEDYQQYTRWPLAAVDIILSKNVPGTFTGPHHQLNLVRQDMIPTEFKRLLKCGLLNVH